MRLLIALLLTCYVVTGFSQTNIGGIINAFSPVTAVANISCHSVVTVANPALFGTGDKVLIIQMKGAVIDSGNSPSFGSILSLNNAGNYEFADVASITGNNIHLTGTLTGTYTISGFVQLVRVPVYSSAVVTSTLTTQAWNGQTGGVLAFFVTNTLTLNSGIDVNGLGFRGGNISNNPDGSCGPGSPDFFYPLTQPGFSWNSGGAMKGEGISSINDDKMAGKGKLANGGGGGNKHNFGGGGGGNYTTGGIGGGALQGCPNTGDMGVGGLSLSSNFASNKLFLGGGGGCGDYNNGVGSNGMNGGGIVIIRAGSVAGNSQTISANGIDELVVGSGIADGVGGGGAGGVVFLDVAAYTSALNIRANGGKGGDQAPNYGCVGTGGGGGTGIVITSQASLPGNVSTTMAAGVAGIFLNSAAPQCAGNNYFATGGMANTSGVLANMPLCEASFSGALTVSLGNDTLICPGQQVLLNATSPGATYQWHDGSTNATFMATAAGTYSVTVTNGLCSGTDAIQVSISPNLPVNLGNDTTICNGQPFTLNATTPNATYQWHDGSGNATYLATTTGNYAVTVSNGACTGTDNINVAFFNSTPVNLGNDTAICAGQSLLLDVTTAGATYSWNNGATGATQTVSSTGAYAITVTLNGCVSTDAIQVTVNPLPTVFLGNDTILCIGQNLVMNTATGNATYLWHDGATGATYAVNITGNYSVTVTQNNCSATDDISVTFVPGPVVNLGNDTTLCNGQSLLLDATYAGALYNWNNGVTSSSQTVTATGIYQVTVSLNGCRLADTLQATFIQPPQIYLGEDTTICQGETLQLVAFCSGCTYLWHDLSTGSSFQTKQPGTYYVAVTNVCGNTSDSVILNTENCDCRIYIPNAFTPNNDGNNDKFLMNYDCRIVFFEMQVFNRIGEKVFETNNELNGWDGKYKSVLQPPGVYVYIIKISDKGGDNTRARNYKGSLTLIR